MNQQLILDGARVIPCDGREPSRDSVVVIENGRIEEVALGLAALDSRRKHANRGGTRIDARDKYLMPGLVDAHVHLDQHGVFGTTQQRLSASTEHLMVNAIRNSVLALAKGVTTVRDLGAKGATNLVVRDAIESGRIVGPSIFACGQMISQTGGHGQGMTTEADGPDAVRRAVRLHNKQGADLIKICMSGGVSEAKRGENPRSHELTESEVEAAVDEAHRAGLRVAAHVHPADAIQVAADAGVDSVEHGSFLDRDRAALLRDRNITLVPTIDNGFTVANHGAALGRPPWMIENAEAHLDTRMAAAAIAIEAGVRIAIGTDIVGEMDREMSRLHEAGMSGLEALAAGTRRGAEVLGLTDRGSISEGMLADILILDRNPLGDLPTLQSSISLVIKNGEPYNPSELRAAIPQPLPTQPTLQA